MSEQRDLCRPQRLNLQSNKKRVERLERIKWAVNVPPRSYLAGSEGVVARGRLQAEGWRQVREFWAGSARWRHRSSSEIIKRRDKWWYQVENVPFTPFFIYHLEKFHWELLLDASFQCCYVPFIIHRLSDAKAVTEVMARGWSDDSSVGRAVGVETCNAINPMIRTMNELQAIAEESADWCWVPQRFPVPGTNTSRGQPSIGQKVIASGWWDETYFIVIPLPNIEGRHLLVGDCFLWELIMQSIIIELAQVFYDRPIRFVDLTIYFGEFPTSIAFGLLVTGVNIYHRDVEGVGRRNLWRS